jgi:hypothetical protein
MKKFDCHYFLKDCFNTFSLVQILMDKGYVTIDNHSSISLNSIALEDMSAPFSVKFKLRRTENLFQILWLLMEKFYQLKLQLDDYSP